jgi:hypothetical protein
MLNMGFPRRDPNGLPGPNSEVYNRSTEQAKEENVGYLVQVPPTRGYYFARSRDHHWANSLMAGFLAALSEQWANSCSTHPFGLGDISNIFGGAPPKHHTHVYGSCVDIYVIHATGHLNSISDPKIDEGHRTAFDPNKPSDDDPYESDSTYDRYRTIMLATTIFSLREPKRFVQFLSDDPEVRKINPKIAPSPKGDHKDHFHIQVR